MKDKTVILTIKIVDNMTPSIRVARMRLAIIKWSKSFDVCRKIIKTLGLNIRKGIN